MLCDGEKLLKEAVAAGIEITDVLFSGAAAPSFVSGANCYWLSEELMSYVSPLKTPQPVLFICRSPEWSHSPWAKRFVLLEGVQDPGNVGTILRTARAMDFDEVIILPGCADYTSSKAVRASMGAVFCQSVLERDYDFLEILKAEGISLYGASLSPDSIDFREADYDRFGLCIGSEGQGLSEKLLTLCDKKLIIPMRKNCESLNAAMAAGILMWEAMRSFL